MKALALAAVALLAGFGIFMSRPEGMPQTLRDVVAPSSTENMPDSTSQPKIVAFGDSLVAGYGATSGNDVASILSRRLDMPIENLGRSGDTTASALLRIDTALDADVAIVLLGGNDFLRAVPLAATRTNLESILRQFSDAGVSVIFIGFGTEELPQYDALFREVTSSTGARYVPNVLRDIADDPTLMADPIHPNDRGYALMADRIEPALREALR